MSFFDDKITKNVADVAAKIMNTKPVVEDKKPDIVIEPITKDAKLIKENKNIKKGKIFSIITEKVENKLKSSEQSEYIVENVVNKLRKESFSDLISIYKNKGFKGLNETITEEVDNETFTKEIKDQQAKFAGKKKGADVAKPAVQAVKQEEVEQIDELSKATLGDYIKKANKDASSKILTGVTKGNTKDLVGANKDLKSAAKRNAGIRKAVDKLTKEGNEMSKLTFKQFVEQLDEMVEFVVTNEEVEQILEYTPGAGGVTKVTGKSYGANYHDPEGDDDADDKPAAKPAATTASAPAAKKGRGRPAGSYGSYKARSAETRAAAAAKSAATKAANKAAKSN